MYLLFHEKDKNVAIIKNYRIQKININFGLKDAFFKHFWTSLKFFSAQQKHYAVQKNILQRVLEKQNFLPKKIISYLKDTGNDNRSSHNKTNTN